MFRFGCSHARLVVRRRRLVPNTFQKEVPTWRHVADPLHAQANLLPARVDVVARGADQHRLVAVPAGALARVDVVAPAVVMARMDVAQMSGRQARKRSHSEANRSRAAKRFASC
jgi:hypothetical protein